jgi:glycosyltransferase involved in cell wall biosynthesis
MKVLYFHQHFATPSGAGGIRSYEMAQALIRAGHQVTMICGSLGAGADTGLTGEFVSGMRRGWVDGIDVVELQLPYSNHDGLARRSLTFLRYARRSVRLALREPCDLVFATSTPLTAALPGIAARWLRGLPFVFEVRDLWPEIPRQMGVIRNPLILGLLAGLEWCAYRSAHRLIGLSPGIVDGIARIATRRDLIDMIPNGCDIERFAADESPWRPDGVSYGDLMAVFAGAHGPANGLDAVLDAAAVLKERGRNDIKLVLVGDGKLKATLQEQARSRGLDNVVFHPPVPKTRIIGLMKATDLGLQILADVPAFYYGTSPNKFFDYLAAGRPVLCNYPGWITDLTRDNGIGYAVPPRDAGAFADALVSASEDRAALAVMGKNALELAHASFSRHTLAERFVAVLSTAAPRQFVRS